MRRKLGLKKGDLVAITETEEGVRITPQEVVAVKALDRIGELLREKGVTLDELIESSRKERTTFIEVAHALLGTTEDENAPPGSGGVWPASRRFWPTGDRQDAGAPRRPCQGGIFTVVPHARLGATEHENPRLYATWL